MNRFVSFFLTIAIILQLSSVAHFNVTSLKEADSQKDGQNNEIPLPSTCPKDDVPPKDTKISNEIDDYSKYSAPCMPSLESKNIRRIPIFCQSSCLEDNLIDCCEKDAEESLSNYVKPFLEGDFNDSFNPLEVWNLYNDDYVISDDEQITLNGKYETLGLMSRTMSILREPKIVHRFTFRWEEGVLTYTYYGYGGDFTRKNIDYMLVINDAVQEYIEKKIYRPKTIKIVEQAKKLPIPAKVPYIPLQRLFYMETRLDEEMESNIVIHPEVRRYIYEWPGSELTITYYGIATKQTSDAFCTMMDVLDWTFENMFLKFAVLADSTNFY